MRQQNYPSNPAFDRLAKLTWRSVVRLLGLAAPYKLPLIIGGILFWVLGAVCFYVEPVVMAALYIIAMLFGYIVPGYLLKRQEDGLRTA